MPQGYDHELTEVQNYFGRDFSADEFVDGYAATHAYPAFDRDDPTQYDNAFEEAKVVAANSVTSIVERLQEAVGEDLDKVDTYLLSLHEEAVQALNPKRLARFLIKEARMLGPGDAAHVTMADVEIVHRAMHHGLEVLGSLMLWRNYSHSSYEAERARD